MAYFQNFPYSSHMTQFEVIELGNDILRKRQRKASKQPIVTHTSLPIQLEDKSDSNDSSCYVVEKTNPGSSATPFVLSCSDTSDDKDTTQDDNASTKTRYEIKIELTSDNESAHGSEKDYPTDSPHDYSGSNEGNDVFHSPNETLPSSTTSVSPKTPDVSQSTNASPSTSVMSQSPNHDDTSIATQSGIYFPFDVISIHDNDEAMIRSINDSNYMVTKGLERIILSSIRPNFHSPSHNDYFICHTCYNRLNPQPPSFGISRRTGRMSPKDTAFLRNVGATLVHLFRQHCHPNRDRHIRVNAARNINKITYHHYLRLEDDGVYTFRRH